MKNHKKPWSDEEIEFLKNKCADLTDKEIGKQLGRTASAVHAYRNKHGINKFNGRKYQRWSDEEDRVIKNHWPESPLEKVTDNLPGRSYNAIKERAQELGVKRNPKFSEEARFKPKEVYEYTDEGVVTIVSTGGARYCVLNKSGKEILYHRYLWEKEHGPIPDDHVLYCNTDDTTNPDPENWELISKAEHSFRNLSDENGKVPSQVLTDSWVADKIADHDPELKNLIINEQPELIGVARANFKLKRQINDGSN